MSSSEYMTTSFIGGWTTVLLVAGAIGYSYYGGKKTPASKAKPAAAATQAPRKEDRRKKQRQEAYTTAAQKAPAQEATPVATTTSAQPKKERDEDSDNKAFAAQMATVQAGKKFTNTSAGNKQQKAKSVKQSHAAEPVAKPAPATKTEDVVEPEAEAEAEPEVEDEEPAASPEAARADPSGVSDMLEPNAAGPSVLRLTNTDKQQKKPKAAKEPEAVETKKQRQNRKKAEERKLAREEDEKERKVLMEKQRRTAREAAGIAAKDGSQFMAAVNGGKSAWNAGTPNGTKQAAKKEETLDVQPLDTFDEVTTDAPAASIAPAKPAASWTNSLPSEEEQIERLKDEDDWNTVPTKTTKKGKKGQAEEVPSAPAQQARPVPQPLAVNGKAAKPAQSYGSFSALSVKGGDADDETNEASSFEEKEWDV